MWISGSGKKIKSFKELSTIVKNKVNKENNTLVLGCDSQRLNRRYHRFVIAVALIDKGNGGIFFIQKWKEKKKYSLADKLYKEAAILIELSNKLMKNNIAPDQIEIHLDLSKNGKSSKFLKGIVGMCTAYGFTTKIKQESWASSGLADRFSKH